MPTNEHICVHFHIFKNAGSTIDWTLEKNFGKNALKFDDKKNPGNIFSPDTVLNYLDKHPAAKAISSHQIRFPLPQSNHHHFLPLVFIRQPIDRAFSVYNFKRREVRTTPCILKAKSASFREFAEYNLKSRTLMVIKNFQTLFLSRQDNKPNITTNDLDKAMKNLQSCPTIGVVDRMDESLVAGEEALRAYFQDIDLSYISQNVSLERTGTLAERMESIKLELGDDVMHEFIRANALDLRLYYYANKELDNRLKQIENLESKLQHFRERCQTHLRRNPSLSFKSIIGDHN